jgi:sedoheptulokinase
MSLVLGIDIGTTSAAVTVVDRSSKEQLATISANVAPAVLCRPEVSMRSEIDATVVLTIVSKLIRDLPSELREKVSLIGVTGQMHGVVLWNGTSPDCVSPLYNWQDLRCQADGWITTLRERVGTERIFTGWGCATLAWLASFQPDIFELYDRSGTIQDFVVSQLTGKSASTVIDPSNAASWGLFCADDYIWDEKKVLKAGIPFDILPTVVPTGTVVGQVSLATSTRFGIGSSALVTVACGDNQASVYGVLQDCDTEMVLTLGTSGQLSIPLRRLTVASNYWPSAIEVRPFVGEHILALRALLCGGKALMWPVTTLAMWMEQIGVTGFDLDSVATKIDLLATSLEPTARSLLCAPFFAGDRVDEESYGRFSNVRFENFSLGEVLYSISKGIIRELKQAMPSELLFGRTRVVASGNGTKRWKILSDVVAEEFGVPLVHREIKEEGAYGAALIAIKGALIKPPIEL